MTFNTRVPIETITDGTPVTYGVVKPGPEDEQGVKFIRGGDVVAGKINIAELRTITNSISQQYKRTLLKGGELLVSLVGNPGEVAVVPDELAGSNIARQVGLIRLDTKRFNPWFVQYYLMSPQGRAQLFSFSLGSVQKVINLKELKRIEIPNIEIDTQNNIVKILKDIDDKIELNRQTNQTLEQIAQAIFKSWFVDFEPVKAKIEAKQNGQDPKRAAMRAISGKIDEELDQLNLEQRQQLTTTAALFPDELVSSELGQIPKGWSVNTFTSVAEIIMGQSPKGDTYNDIGNGTALVNGPVEFGVYHPLKIKWTTSPTKLSIAGDLIVCVRGSTTGRFVKSDGEYCLGRGVCAIRSNNYQPFVDELYKYQLSTLLSLTTGSVFPSWSGPTLKNYRTVRPNESLLKAYSDYVNTFKQLISNDAVETETLSDIRDQLLPKLLSGEMTPGNTQTTAEAVA